MRGARSRRGGSNTILFDHTARSAICHPPSTRNHWLVQHAAANEREAEFSRSKWSNEGARHNFTRGSPPDWKEQGSHLKPYVIRAMVWIRTIMLHQPPTPFVISRSSMTSRARTWRDSRNTSLSGKTVAPGFRQRH